MTRREACAGLREDARHGGALRVAWRHRRAWRLGALGPRVRRCRQRRLGPQRFPRQSPRSPSPRGRDSGGWNECHRRMRHAAGQPGHARKRHGRCGVVSGNSCWKLEMEKFTQRARRNARRGREEEMTEALLFAEVTPAAEISNNPPNAHFPFSTGMFPVVAIGDSWPSLPTTFTP